MLYKNTDAAQADRDCIRALGEIRKHLRAQPFDPLNVHLTKYAIIVSSGAIERSYKSIVADYVTKDVSQELVNYIDVVVRNGISNPRLDNIAKLLNQFCDRWKDEFNRILNGMQTFQQDSQALASLVKNRNAVAHGKGVSCGINDIVGYYFSARRIVSKLECVLV